MNLEAAKQRESDASGSPPRRTARRWVFRLAALLLGLTPLLAFEGLCTWLDWGRPDLQDDPFVGFRSVRPLFVLNKDETRYEIPKSRQGYFRPESFAATKPRGEFRVFCLGGSTVQGRPFAIETSFTTWLEIALQAADPSRPWEVVNCGGVSYASYRLIPIVEEVLRYAPDLIILYTGHNEFLEARAFDHVKNRGAVINTSLDVASRLHTFTLLREGYLRLHGKSSSEPPQARPILPTEVEAMLDYRGGLRDYHHDDAWRRGVIAQYRYNLRRMVEMARAAGVDVLLVNPASNDSDSPPFKSEHRADLTPAELEQWESHVEAARRHLHGQHRDLHAAIEQFDRACQIDPLHAGGFYNLAKCYETAGQLDRAREAYLRAKEVDVCPLRILQPMNESVLEIAAATRTPLVDAQQLFEQHSADGIVGGEWLVDHVHPSVDGHQLLADALADKLISLGTVAAGPNWEDAKRRRYREHLDALDDFYFVKGVERRKAVRGWAAGRARLLRPEEQSNEPAPTNGAKHDNAAQSP